MPPFHISLVAFVVFLACGGVLLALLMPSGGAEPPASAAPPEPIAKQFLTAREEAMLTAIERVLPDHRIHAQVAMGALLRAPQQPGRRSHPAERNRFSQKIVDFVIQDRNSGAVVALVEVDDHLHVTRRDRARDAMTGAAGYKTIRIDGSTTPTLGNVRLALAPICQRIRQERHVPPGTA